MKFDKIMSENTNMEVPKNQIDVGDLGNPMVKNIMTQIEQEKKRSQKTIENLMKRLEQVKAKNNSTGQSIPGM